MRAGLTAEGSRTAVARMPVAEARSRSSTTPMAKDCRMGMGAMVKAMAATYTAAAAVKVGARGMAASSSGAIPRKKVMARTSPQRRATRVAVAKAGPASRPTPAIRAPTAATPTPKRRLNQIGRKPVTNPMPRPLRAPASDSLPTAAQDARLRTVRRPAGWGARTASRTGARTMTMASPTASVIAKSA